jgi:hypothetical protein
VDKSEGVMKPILKNYASNEKWTLTEIFFYAIPVGIVLYGIGLFVYEGWFRY